MILICVGYSLFAQKSNHKSKTFTHTLISEQNYEYKILVTTPLNYDKSKKYKTLYYLDAWWLEDIVKGNYTLLNITKLVEEIILVGISINGSPDEFTKQRTRDYTPTPYSMDFPFTIPMESESLLVDANNSGKAESFIRFLKSKVFPLISKEYSISSIEKGFIGHSFGGLFGMYDAMDKEPLFDKHIIIAPALWWNKSFELYKKIEENIITNKLNANIFICYGENESMSVSKSTNNLIEYINANEIDNIKYRFEIYNKDDHVSLLPKSIYDGIKYFYKK